MAKRPNPLALSAEETQALLAQSATLRIATIGPGTDINLTPMTYGCAGGRIYLFGRGQKVANLRRNPTATVLVDTGTAWRELQGVMLRGRAWVLETAAEEQADPYLAEAQQDLGCKHGLKKDGKRAPYAPTASGRSRRWIVFEPKHQASWDNGKLSG